MNLELSRDFVSRASLLSSYLTRRDMKMGVNTLYDFANGYMAAVLDNAAARHHPEVVADFIQQNPVYYEDLSKKLLVKDEWMNHPNAKVWLTELFQQEHGPKHFLAASFDGVQDAKDAVKRFRRAYPYLKANMTPDSAYMLLNYMGRYQEGTPAFDAFERELMELARTPEFAKMIAAADPEFSRVHEKFLRWLQPRDPAAAKVYAEALRIPGTAKKAFWKITPDHSRYYQDDAGYERAQARTSRERLNFIAMNMPAAAPSTSRSLVPAASCPGNFSRTK